MERSVEIPDSDAAAFRQDLLSWWQCHGREFPWRNTRDPYRILIAEVLLHRTRAKQVVPLYHTFLHAFPDIHALAAASLSAVTEVLASAGLRWRVELLHEMAKRIVNEHEGEIPSGTEELRSLPGVGHYISGAVRCFAFDQPEVLLDTNTVRIAGRVFGVPVTDASRRSRRFRRLLERLLDRENPQDFNHALIDLGAQLCVSGEPLCCECPVRGNCSYGSQARCS